MRNAQVCQLQLKAKQIVLQDYAGFAWIARKQRPRDHFQFKCIKVCAAGAKLAVVKRQMSNYVQIPQTSGAPRNEKKSYAEKKNNEDMIIGWKSINAKRGVMPIG